MPANVPLGRAVGQGSFCCISGNREIIMSNKSQPKSGGTTRRDVLKAGLGLLGLGSAGTLAGCGSSDNSVPQQEPLPPVASFPQPPVLNSVNGTLSFPLGIFYATNPVGTPNGVRNLRSRTFNGRLAGATLRVRAGDRLMDSISNQLPLPNPPGGLPVRIPTPRTTSTVPTSMSTGFTSTRRRTTYLSRFSRMGITPTATTYR
jgi:FtsP/CotA-like multicopper oxidase with cupredoxin domain